MIQVRAFQDGPERNESEDQSNAADPASVTKQQVQETFSLFPSV